MTDTRDRDLAKKRSRLLEPERRSRSPLRRWMSRIFWVLVVLCATFAFSWRQERGARVALENRQTPPPSEPAP